MPITQQPFGAPGMLLNEIFIKYHFDTFSVLIFIHVRVSVHRLWGSADGVCAAADYGTGRRLRHRHPKEDDGGKNVMTYETYEYGTYGSQSLKEKWY